MITFSSISSVADVNPKIPMALKSELDRPVSFLSMSAISETGEITSSEESILDSVIKGYRYFETGDVLFAKITPCMENGKAVFVENIPHEIGFGSTEFHVLRPSSEIDGRYLFYMVWNPMFRYIAERNMTGTAGQRRVPTDFVKRFKIPLPPLEEQKRIAAILDKADAIRRKRKEAIALTEELLRSTFLDMFGDPVTNPKGWNILKFGSQVDELKYGSNAKCSEFREKGDIPVLRIPNIVNEKISLNELKYAKLESSEVDKLLLKQDDLLFVRSNGNPDYIGRCALFEGEIIEAAYASYLIRARLRKDTDFYSAFIRDIVSFPTFRSRLAKEARTTAGNYNINTQGLKSLKLICPPKEKQRNYLKFREKITERLKVEHNYLNISSSLFNSLLQKAFRGEL